MSASCEVCGAMATLYIRDNPLLGEREIYACSPEHADRVYRALWWSFARWVGPVALLALVGLALIVLREVALWSR